jgi:DNA polymerase III epsilon subunit-like protein
VRPDGWEVAPGAQRVHGISTAFAFQHGAPVVDVLRAFDAEMQETNLVIAHNLEFDETIMTAEFLRAGMRPPFDDVSRFCTMRGTARMCELRPKVRGEYKWPKLSELHQICTGKPHAGAHDAMGDAEAVLRCLRLLRKNRMVAFDVSIQA